MSLVVLVVLVVVGARDRYSRDSSSGASASGRSPSSVLSYTTPDNVNREGDTGAGSDGGFDDGTGDGPAGRRSSQAAAQTIKLNARREKRAVRMGPPAGKRGSNNVTAEKEQYTAGAELRAKYGFNPNASFETNRSIETDFPDRPLDPFLK